MNAGAGRYAWPASPSPQRGEGVGTQRGQGVAAPTVWAQWIVQRVRVRHLLVLAVVLVYPWVATPFFTFQVGAQSLALGLIALSLTFLAGYGGMISLAQMTVAGIAGYTDAIFGARVTDISLRW